MDDVELLITNAREGVTLAVPGADPTLPRTGRAMDALGIVADGAVAVSAGRIAAVGPARELERTCSPRAKRLDARGGIVLPGFVDSHTHPVFAATREGEFYRRMAGVPYMEIAREGGGINASARALRAMSEDELERVTRRRLDGFIPLGTTTVEAKSGYGLSLESELASLRVLARIAKDHPLDIVPTFLGAHDIPTEHKADRRAYIDCVVHEMIPRVVEEGLALFCDVFCETGVFTPDESEEILRAGQRHGLASRIHADELARSGGARVAARVGAISADHLVMVEAEEIEALRAAGVIATLLPGTAFHLDKARKAPARALIEAGVAVALATDFNPGTSMTRSMGMVLSLAVIQLKMSAAEAITAATHNAACALGLAAELGRIERGLKADLVIHDVPSHAVLPYHFGESHVATVVKDGQIVWRRPEPFHDR